MAPKAKNTRETGGFGRLPNDLYGYAGSASLPRAGRREMANLCDWTVRDNWPECIPVTDREIDAFEAWFGDVFDRLFGACQ
ncbi:hypothetical protein BZU93_24280 [Salmonella enterica subsp. enterica]|nr:hypothetical protein [Salmonella enterica subsp. enterica serovar Kottbus]EBW2249969.1 hypothetical protein [Salmonella enterica subsp. enterica serovar Enteritidis]EBX4816653.1 hypothetical protein [Salmonella enterica subsp. enterica serovar Newport]ECI7685668.1 hypothetical protein [Salmonella enterica subsp. enterica serovar Paratyphi A]EFG6100469.1 hypothetical protein [Escherichia coli]